MSATRSLLAAALLTGLAGCSPRRIPGTEIPDTADTRAIVGLLDRYRQAVERRDPAAVLALVSGGYFDDAGTPDPADDLDRTTLEKVLPQDLGRLASVRFDVRVNDVRVDGDRAEAFLRFDARYRITTRGGEVPKAQTDVSRVVLVREKAGWRIASGL
ncbi:MAG TPA: nuclear transport factor 2 family protein [Anaeromyxobacteraceae bacterium]